MKDQKLAKDVKCTTDDSQDHVLGYVLSREEASRVGGGMASVPTSETPYFYSDENLHPDESLAG